MEEALREVIRKHWKRLSKIPNVVGYSVPSQCIAEHPAG